MKISNECLHYFNGFNQVAHFKTNETKTNIVAALKIFSYFTIIVPVSVLAVYGASTLFDRVHRKEETSPQDAKIKLQAEKNIRDENVAIKLLNLGIEWENKQEINAAEFARISYEKSAGLGNSEALNKLGVMYRDGHGVKRDLERARDYFEQSAEKGNANALYNLGCMYAFGEGVEVDFTRAHLCFTLAANKGHVDAHYDLGVMYHDGEGVKVDFKRASEYYKQAAEKDHVDALHNLGVMYRDGQGVEVDFTLSRQCFKRAADMGDKSSSKELAEMYRLGKGGDIDPQAAMSYYEKAEDATALFKLGVTLMKENNHLVARECFEKAAELGSVEALNNLGFQYSVEDPERALKYFEEAAKKGSAVAMYNLASMYYYGRGIDPDPKLAKEYYQQAVAKGYQKAQEALDKLDF